MAKIAKMLIGLTPNTIAGIITLLKKRDFQEPVASLEECNLVKLSSSLKTPFLRPDLENKSENFCEKATHIFYLLTENHCFSNSNKRIAVVSLVTFADINGYKINTTEVSLYALSMATTLLTKYGLVEEAKYEINKVITDSLTKKSGQPLKKNEIIAMEKEFIEFMESKS